MNDRREVLAVQERTGPASKVATKMEYWKTPTGLVDGGEDVAAAAVREVREETGVEAEVVSLVAVREAHGITSGVQGSSNLYFVFLMRPVSRAAEQMRIQESEILA